MSESIHVLLVSPEQYPKEITIESDLSSLQAAVGGFIEAIYPFEDELALVINV